MMKLLLLFGDPRCWECHQYDNAFDSDAAFVSFISKALLIAVVLAAVVIYYAFKDERN